MPRRQQPSRARAGRGDPADQRRRGAVHAARPARDPGRSEQLLTRPFAVVRELLLERARERRNPLNYTEPDETTALISTLESTEDDSWTRTFVAAAARHVELAIAAERAGDAEATRQERRYAYGFYRIARYPAPTTPAKLDAYRRSQQWYLQLARTFDPPLQRVRIPFPGRSGEGQAIVADLRVPRRGPPDESQVPPGASTVPPGASKATARPPVAVVWGGIDSFKEERLTDVYLARGIATLAIDMPGTADAPIPGSLDAERLWDPIFDWLEARDDVDGRRVAVAGNSTGGYWAAKLAHTRRDRIRAAVDHGGPAHHAFERAWIERSEEGEYPFALPETLAAAFGRRTREEWIEYAPSLSLLRLDVLDGPCAPLLLVNGVEDSVFPIADMHLLLAHGDPKTARFYPGGHMGRAPGIAETIADWLAERLRA